MLISVFGVCGLRLLWLFTVVPAHHTLLERRLRAMYLSRALICRELSGADGRER